VTGGKPAPGSGVAVAGWVTGWVDVGPLSGFAVGGMQATSMKAKAARVNTHFFMVILLQVRTVCVRGTQ
jgi:hypothetical protein